MDITELDAMLKAAKQPEKTVPICLRGDLQADWEDLDEQLSTLRTKSVSTATLASSSTPEETELAARIEALQEEMKESTLHLRLRALRRRAWMKLIDAHPKREDNDIDKLLGMNQEAFFPALIAESLVSPKLDADQLDELLDTMTSRQYEVLTEAAWQLNRADVSVPFSYTASTITKSSAGTSGRPSGSGSRTAGSPGGSRKK